MEQAVGPSFGRGGGDKVLGQESRVGNGEPDRHNYKLYKTQEDV